VEILYKPTTSLAGYARNARTHSAAQVEQIVASITEFGFNNPILIDEAGTVIAGHGRLAAATKMGLAEVPCIVLAHLTDAQRRAYVLADNKIALNSGWNEELLKLELADLRLLDIDLGLLGFGDKELGEMLPVDPAGGFTDPDDVPDLPMMPVTRSGDVWLLGRHRLLCGDCTLADCWNVVLAGEKVEVVWTDPPYNVNYGDKAESLNKANKGHRNCSKILNDNMATEDFLLFMRGVYRALFAIMEPGAPIYVAHAETERANFTAAFLEMGFKLSTNIIWKKSQLVLGRSDFQYIHEPILYGWKPGAGHPWYGGRKNVSVQEFAEHIAAVPAEGGGYMLQAGDDMLLLRADAVVDVYPTTIMSVAKPQRNDVHPTMKPIALVEKCLRCSAKPGAIVADGFGGSGTTLMAAERLQLQGRVIEMSEHYCDVIVKRWQEYTGQVATLEDTGEPFPG